MKKAVAALAAFLPVVCFVGAMTNPQYHRSAYFGMDDGVGASIDDAGVITTNGQIVSTVATGTPPLAVTSTTKVQNLNADLLDGLDSTGYQRADAELLAIAGLTSAANKIPYFTGSGAAGLLSLGAFGDDLLGFTDAAAAKTGLGLGNVENTALSTWAGSANITTVGTIASGTWSGTTVGATKGGTGQTSATQGDLLYASGANTWAKLPKATSARMYLSNTGTNYNPAWAQVNLTDGVTGVLPVANGGTGANLCL